MEWGGKLEMLQERAAAGLPTPSLEKMPEVPYYLQWIWEAFSVLSGCRPASIGGALAIPMTELHAYCMLKRIDNSDEIDDLIYFIRELDTAYLKWCNSKRQSK